MTTTFTKISIALAFVAVSFGAFGFMTSTDLFISDASAQTSCGDCGGGGTGGGGTGGGGTIGGDGGGSSVTAPVCTISINKAVVVAGGQYTMTWNVVSAAPVNVYINDYKVAKSGSATYTFNGANLKEDFTLRANNAGGNCVKVVEIKKSVPAVVAPVCNISANVTSVAVGGTYTLTWNGTPAAATFKINGAAVTDSGSKTLTFVGPNSESFTFTGVNGDKTCTKTVVVTKSTPTPLPTCTLFASPTSITAGGSTRLTWTSSNASGTATINQSIGVVNPTNTAGFRDVSPATTTTYIMTVKNSAGQERTCSRIVTVTPAAPLAPICNSFTATPATINRGQSTVLAWNTTNVSSVTINNGVGTQAVDGSVPVSPIDSVTYRLTAVGTNGQTITCDRPVTVIQPESPTTPRCEFFNVSDNVITRGETVTLSWDTTNATNVIINPTVGSVAVDGSTNVAPSDSTTYTLTATAANGQTVSCTRPVTVETSTNGGGSNGGGGGSSSPKCTLKISDSKISRGDRITLKWDTSRATEITLKDSSGKTLVTTEDKNSSDKKDLYDGEITLRPEQDTTYTLLAERGSKDRTCKVSVDVSGGVTVTEVRDQKPVVTGISLTQVPYTGFEAGPFLTMMFYGLLLLWALYLAYVLVARRTGLTGAAIAQTSPFMPTIVHDAKVSQTNSAVEVINTPRFVAPVAASTAVASPVIGYATAIATDSAYESIANTIEAAAHSERVLFSGEAMRRLVESTTEDNRATTVVAILAKAKASYPSEDGWVVINIDRMQNLIAMIA